MSTITAGLTPPLEIGMTAIGRKPQPNRDHPQRMRNSLLEPIRVPFNGVQKEQSQRSFAPFGLIASAVNVGATSRIMAITDP